MQASPTAELRLGRRALSFLMGVGMVVASAITINHFFAANYPESIFAGSVCDINAFFNCDGSAYSSISQIFGVPLGWFGVAVGGLVALGALFPSAGLERTNKSIALLNAIGVVVLFLYSVFILGSLCLYCTAYYLFSLLSLLIYRGFRGSPEVSQGTGFLQPSWLHLAVFGVVSLAGAWGMAEYHQVRRDAQTGTAMKVVSEYYSLPEVALPSIISPYWTARATERFEDAPVQIIEYADPLCPDCLFLAEQLDMLKEEFPGKLNIAFQFFPLEDKCNQVVDKNFHPGACDLSLIAAHDPEKFPVILDEIWANFQAARRDPDWRWDLACRHGVEEALTDPETQAMLGRLIATGAEYEKTSERFPYGIRSTPTMIINNRMVIGTMPYIQLKAIVEALIEEKEGGAKFIEEWVSD